jgi:hypothetical protein
MWAKLPQEHDELVNLRWNLAELVRFVLTEQQKHNHIHVHVCWYLQESRIATVPFGVITDEKLTLALRGGGSFFL